MRKTDVQNSKQWPSNNPVYTPLKPLKPFAKRNEKRPLFTLGFVRPPYFIHSLWGVGVGTFPHGCAKKKVEVAELVLFWRVFRIVRLSLESVEKYTLMSRIMRNSLFWDSGHLMIIPKSIKNERKGKKPGLISFPPEFPKLNDFFLPNVLLTGKWCNQ